MKKGSCDGFTLIELSIVLVIIGLVVGGVLVGRNLISAAAVRAQITQIEKFNTAANTFFGKYGGLPGDICGPAVTQFGFVARAGGEGRGDCNGFVEGFNYRTGNPYGWNATGETAFFWEDLSSAGLIEGTFSTASDTHGSAVTGPAVATYIPAAKLGQNNYIYVYSKVAYNVNNSGLNYFGISQVSEINDDGNISAFSLPGITVSQAYALDSKVDDGLPQTGNVTAVYLFNCPNGICTVGYAWADGDNGPGDGTPTPPSPTSCYDDRGVTGAVRQYSLIQNSGAGVNCGLSFKMQAGR